MIDAVAAMTRALAEVGVRGIAPADLGSAWKALGGCLEQRVGVRLSRGVSDDLLVEFFRLSESADAQACGAWLDAHAPNHAEIVAEETARLIDEAVSWFAARSAADAGCDGDRSRDRSTSHRREEATVIGGRPSIATIPGDTDEGER